ncbi:HypC/HybG/HupF family hydrogenase formation chaperone [Stieleria varia]|uniref:Hydrogenase isoenzymes formation protein HypC n=1 Tax=Stieleria varia TaxID=2528005 RepID=A0A5C5ZUP4_9BACT|nr:HypC/HybG/HupF family hydrogenase formation chaperone [Stieleria varia]TWT91274.1 Hydrogenase isoenzymes formation protein HypC [Stieleria varia]
MCLGVPGRVQEWLDQDPLFARARVEFAGVCRDVHMACVTDAKVGDYVVVHAGIAICIVDEQQAQTTLGELSRLDKMDRDDEAEKP